jgi:hypothetical protein
MVLLAKQLEKYGISAHEVEHLVAGLGSPYGVVDAARTKFFEQEYPKTTQYVGEIQHAHKEAANILKHLRRRSEPQRVHEYLLRVNTCHESVEDGGCRTLVLLDATGSMAGVLSLTKQTIGTMFQRAFDVLRGQGVAGFALQIGVYRNYNVRRPEQAFEASEWESSPEPLFDFLHGIGVAGGKGREAIELGLRHANQEHAREPVSQVIVIGDAPPQSPAQADKLRRRYHFPTPTYFDDERAALINEGIDLHAFYVPTQASTRVAFACRALHVGHSTAPNRMASRPRRRFVPSAVYPACHFVRYRPCRFSLPPHEHTHRRVVSSVWTSREMRSGGRILWTWLRNTESASTCSCRPPTRPNTSVPP